MNNYLSKLFLLLLITASASSQSLKEKSYIISKEDLYTIDIKDAKPLVTLNSVERKWVGDKDDNQVRGNKINYVASFEDISDIEAYSLSPEKKKDKVRMINTEDVEIEDIFYHDMKFKYYYFNDLKSGSETYSSYRKTYKKPEFLDRFYFKDNLECKSSKITLKVNKDIEIGYVLQGSETEKVEFISQTEGNYNLYTWQLKDMPKEEFFENAPNLSYYSPHLIFYIKNYKTATGTKNVLGSVNDLYNFYWKTVKNINKTDQTALKELTDGLTKGLTNDLDKTRAIFNFVQTKVNYVAFEDGMGGFIPREAADVLQKRYGDCKDMANLLNEMLNYAKIESHIAWIGTRSNNYTYEKIPTPIVDNHMIAVAKIDNEYIFLDATGQYTLFPGFTPFIQGKQALMKIDKENHKVISVPVIDSDKNNTNGKIKFEFSNNSILGKADFQLSGFIKSQLLGQYKNTTEKAEMLKIYLSRFIQNITTSNIDIKNDDLTQKPLEIKYDFALDKWTKHLDNQIIFKPILFFPLSDSRIDNEKRKIPVEFDFKKSYEFEYEFTIPEGYKIEFKPENFATANDLIKASITYTLTGNKLLINQKMAINTLLLEEKNFEAWNTSIKAITKQYNQNIILAK